MIMNEIKNEKAEEIKEEREERGSSREITTETVKLTFSYAEINDLSKATLNQV